MKSRPTVIELRDVEKIYHLGKIEVPAIRGISTQIKDGDFVAVQGPSGSGKSTLMNLIGCLDVPTKGDIFLDGENIAHMSESDLAQVRGRRIGFVFQSYNLLPNMTALENVMLPMVFQGRGPEERRERAEMLLELVDLKDRMDHRPTELSGGQQQRVAIARALANDPEVVLADEPTGNLDSKTSEEVMKFFDKLNKVEDKTIILVTHDKSVAKHARKVLRIIDGKLKR